MSEFVWLEPDELRAYRAFARASRALFAQFDRELERDVGLPRAFFEILWFLDQAPERALRMSELAERMRSAPSAVTHAVSRLEQQGDVRRELCAEDRRGWFAVLTDQGAETLRVAAPRYAESIRAHFLGPLSAVERAQITAIGERLLDALAASEEAAEAPASPRARAAGRRAPALSA